MNYISKNKTRTIAEILDSDDELPDSYEEAAVIPAYLNDSRFDRKVINTSTQFSVENENCVKVKESNVIVPSTVTTMFVDGTQRKNLISEGTLSTRDLFFIKSIEEHCSESTLLWFIESLKHKYLTRVYSSCLAYDISQTSNNLNVESFITRKPNYYFDLVIHKQ